MPTRLTRAAYSALIQEDLLWLDSLPRTVESEHVKLVVKDSIHTNYGNEGAEAVCTLYACCGHILLCKAGRILAAALVTGEISEAAFFDHLKLCRKP